MIKDRLCEFVTAMPDNQKRPHEWRMSGLGECVRKLEYQIIEGLPETDHTSWLRMESGTWLHKMMQDLVSKCFGEDFHSMEREVEVDIDGTRVVGHPDGILTSLDAVVEFKSVSSSTMAKILKESKPLDAHIEQANTYAIALNLGWVLIIYFDRDACEFHEFCFEVDHGLYELTKAKVNQAKTNAANGVLSTRPYHDKTESPCWFCSFKDKCYEGFSKEVSEFGKGEVYDLDLNASLEMAGSSRRQRLDAEKLEDAAKKDVISKMMMLKMNFIQGSKHKALMKIGKNGNPLVEIKEIE